MTTESLILKKQPKDEKRPADAKGIQNLPGDITASILEFSGLLSLHYFMLTNKEASTLLDLKNLIEQRALPREWERVVKSKQFSGLVSLENLPKQLMAKGQDRQRIILLQYAIQFNFFSLIKYLNKNGVDINSPWVTFFEDRHGSMVSTETVEHKALDKVLNTSPLNPNTLHRLIDVGFEPSKNDFHFVIIPGALDILKKDHSSPTTCQAAGKLLMLASKKKFLSLDNVVAILKVAKKIDHPLMIQMEARYLIYECQKWDTTQLLKQIMPFSMPVDLLHTEDLDVIRKSIPQYEAFKKILYRQAKSEQLEKKSKGALLKCLDNLQNQKIIHFVSPTPSSIQRCNAYLYNLVMTPLTFFNLFFAFSKNSPSSLQREEKSKQSINDSSFRKPPGQG